MTALLTRTIGQTLLIAAFAVSAPSTPSFAWTAETRAKCAADAWRLCSSVGPNIQKTDACMDKQSASFSARCKAAVEKERAAAQKKPSPAATPSAATPSAATPSPAATPLPAATPSPAAK
jgi:hypothetical protein